MAVVAALTGCSAGERVGTPEVDRLLVMSLPGLSWDDVDEDATPNLRGLARRAAVGNLATRLGRRSATPESAYLTMGAGTRAVAPEDGAGVVLEDDELYHGQPAASVLRRRLGRVPEGGAAYLAIGAASERNEGSVFGADIGMLGDALTAADVHRAVIANADLREGRVDDAAYGREAAAVLIGSDGVVPEGVVGRRLLVDDPSAPYGVRLDEAMVLDAFRAAWSSTRVVALVEASDLQRAGAYGKVASKDARATMRAGALRDADRLLGALLDELTDRDAVLVVSPVAPSGAPDLGIVALVAPGVDTGLLRSATTRRDGYVQLADVAPTILSLLGEELPDGIEGRPFRVVESGGGAELRTLADATELASFRDGIVPATVTAFISVLAALCLATFVRDRLPRRVRAALPAIAAGVIGALPASFLTARAGIDAVLPYVAFLVAAGAVVAGVATVAERRRPGTGMLVAVGSVVALIGLDIAAGAPLQLNTVFGYSVAVAGRFAGIGNLAFALLGSAAVVLAALIAERHPRGRPWHALAVLGVVLLIDGLPVLGADVGGVLAMVPAFGLAALVLLGRRIRVRAVVALLAMAFAILGLFAFLDLARPEESQTHLARLADHVVERRWDPLLDSLTRRWMASFGSGDTGAWVVLAVLGAVVAAVVVVRGAPGTRRLPSPPSLSRPEAAAGVGLAVLATLGLITNDSSFAVPATMLLVIVPVLVHRATVTSAP